MTVAIAGDVPSETGCSTVSFWGPSSAMAGAASETARTAGRARRARSFFMDHFLEEKRPGHVRRQAATGRARRPLCGEQNDRQRAGDERRAERVAQGQLALADAGGDGHGEREVYEPGGQLTHLPVDDGQQHT